jgi:6-phosphogluconolactonase/glucosamine-6-phosphate isomerase/deaminase
MNVNAGKDAISDCANAVADELRRLIGFRKRAIAIIGVQANEVALIDRLVTEPAIDWTRVVCFQASEQIGCAEDSPGSERRFLNRELAGRVPLAELHGLRGEAPNLHAVCVNYEALLRSRPPDLALIGAGRLLEAPTIHSRHVVVGSRTITMTQNGILNCPRIFVVAKTTHEVDSLRGSPAGEHDGVQVFIS